MANGDKLLEVRNLRTYFDTDAATVKAVDGLSFHVGRGETLGMVGESGSGKSVTSLSIMGLVPAPAGRIAGGQILFEGEDLVAMPEPGLRSLRGKRMSMIFQDARTSLNPVFPVGRQIAETITLHEGISRPAALRRATELLELVGIPEPGRRARDYPHQLSGGMCQRVMIAMALSCTPRLLIADEPTTALDVTIQAQILELLKALRTQFDMSILFITHDLGVVAEMADRVVVLYAGRCVEEAPVRELFGSPLMPYTAGLLQSVPRPGRKARLQPIAGAPAHPARLPAGCAFHPRCAHAEKACRRSLPPLEGAGGGRRVRCLRWRDLELSTRPAP